jgi:hypothetical protein
VTSDAKTRTFLPACTTQPRLSPQPHQESRGRVFLSRPSRRFMSPLRTAAPCGRPAHRLGDCAGRSPGSRVVASVQPSRFPSGQKWTQARRSQLRGQPRSGLSAFRVPFCSPGLPGNQHATSIGSRVKRVKEEQGYVQMQRGQLCSRPLRALRILSAHRNSIPCAEFRPPALNGA